MIPESFFEELKYRNDIVTVIGNYVSLRRRGRNLVGLCPFHSEKTPSFTVYPDSQSFYCFGCGAGGDVISFIRRMEHLEYLESVRFLAERSGMEIPDSGAGARRSESRKRTYALNREAARCFHKTLMSGCGAPARGYLARRGLRPGTVTRFGLGYAPESWDHLLREMKRLGFTENELKEANLAAAGRNGSCYDVFRNRLIFPIIDLRGNVIAFGGRDLGSRGPKYLNSSDTPVFRKRRSLFALNFAKEEKTDRLILCEGYMDVVTLHQSGFKNAVATLGTSLTEDQARLMGQYAREVILSYDSDEAGQTATRRATDILESAGLKVRILSLPDCKDPDEFLNRHGRERFRQALDSSGNPTEHQLARLRADYDLETPAGKVGFLKEAARVLASVSSPVEREVYLGKLGSELAVDKEAVKAEVNRAEQKRRKRDRYQTEKALIRNKPAAAAATPEEERLMRNHPKKARAEERLLSYLIRHPDRWRPIREKLPAERFLTRTGRDIYEALTARLRDGRPIGLSELGEDLPDSAMGRLTGWMVGKDMAVSAEEAADCIRVLLESDAALSKEEVKTLDREALRRYISELRERKDR